MVACELKAEEPKPEEDKPVEAVTVSWAEEADTRLADLKTYIDEQITNLKAHIDEKLERVAPAGAERQTQGTGRDEFYLEDDSFEMYDTVERIKSNFEGTTR